MDTKSGFQKYKFIAIASAIGLLPLSANATLMLSATVNGTQVCATDNNVACFFGTQLLDTDPTIGFLQLPTTVNVSGVIVNGSLHKSIKGNPDTLSSSSLSITNNNNTNAQIQVAIGDTDFMFANSARTTSSGTFVRAAGSQIESRWFNDPNNNQGAETPADLPGLQVDLFSFTSTINPDSFSHNGGPFAVSDPGLYSMTEAFRILLTPGGSLDSRGQVEVKTSVPEPGSISLFGIGLAGALALYRRKMKGK